MRLAPADDDAVNDKQVKTADGYSDGNKEMNGYICKKKGIPDILRSEKVDDSIKSLKTRIYKSLQYYVNSTITGNAFFRHKFRERERWSSNER